MFMDLLKQNKLNRLTIFTFVLVVMLFLIMGCSPKTRYQVLSFFFDGVPNPEQKAATAQKTTADTLQSKQNRRLSLRRPQEPQQFFHPPFADRDCGACHDMGGGNRLNAPVPDLCFECHDDFRQELEVLHGPVAAGACTACHHPHVSKNEKLLARAGQELCLYCHDIRDVRKNDAHEDLGTTLCTECHDAHGGDEIPFLK